MTVRHTHAPISGIQEVPRFPQTADLPAIEPSGSGLDENVR